MISDELKDIVEKIGMATLFLTKIIKCKNQVLVI